MDVIILSQINGNSSKIVSSLEKIFPENKIEDFSDYSGFSMFKNEKKSFQIVFSAKKGDKISFSANSELLKYLTFCYVKLIPCKLAAPKTSDNYYISKKGGLYPDLLEPVIGNNIIAEYDGLNSIWVEIKPISDELPTGKFYFDFNISGCKIGEDFTIEIIDEFLPKQKLIYTNWFHTDCLMSYYKVDAFSDEYWRIVKNYLKKANEYGMNCVLTPLFTPPLDTEVGGERPTVQLVQVKFDGENNYSFDFSLLDKWLKMCDECKIEYYEMSHFFTQWGAKHAPKIIADINGKQVQIFGWKTKAKGKEYKEFLRQFSVEFKKFIDEKGIKEKCLIHISDEPAPTMLRGYKKASKIIHELFGEFKIVDAMSSYPLSKKCKMKYPIPANNMIEPFIGKTEELWTYYCCCQANKNVSNRFFSMPSQRNRVLGYQLYKYNAVGFLHWGFNFYYSQYSKRNINPYEETDAGEAFSSGDAFVVYPGADGTPLNSLRLNVFYDAFQDMMALQLLESKIGRDKTLAILESDTDNIPITFSKYPHSAKWLLETREKINEEIQKCL